MKTIRQLSKYVRTKNAGPFWITIDIFCDEDSSFQKLCESKTICPQTFADLFHTSPASVKIFEIPSLRVIKISVPRELPQGHRYESDMHAGQQYVKILDLKI